MHSDDADLEPQLDRALERLGMPSTNSRREYLEEMRKKSPYVNMVQINTRYVSNVSIGFRVRPLLPHVRYKPYTIRERHRTRSENNDTETANPAAPVASVTEKTDDLNQLKKAKSLESILAESNINVDLQGIALGPAPELEIVTHIENLKVGE